MKKVLALILAMLMVVACVACTATETTTTTEAPAAETKTEAAAETVSETVAVAESKTGDAAVEAVAEDGVDYNHMTMDELYELAKAEEGTIVIYCTSKDHDKISKKLMEDYPELEGKFEYNKIDTDEMAEKITLEYETGNINADVVAISDASGSIYNELLGYDMLDVYYPAAIYDKIDSELTAFGLPLKSSFNPWFYNTEMFPDGCPVSSWWDIVEGYNVDTGSYTDANGNNTQKWTIFSKDITSPNYSAQFAQMILDADMMAEQYKAQYGEDLVITYTDKLQNVPGMMELPENNAGVELYYRFTQMEITVLDDGDAVVQAVHESLNGATLGLTSAGKLELKEELGYNIAWVTGLQPYTGLNGTNYIYVTKGCDNPAGARMYIYYALGGESGSDGAYDVFDDFGAWSVRSDVVFEDSGATKEEVNLRNGDFNAIYELYPNVTAYWKLWHK